MTQSTSDFRSNANEQVEHAVKVIGKSAARRKVFEAIYHHKSKAKTVTAIVNRTKLKRMRVLQEGRHLYGEKIVGQTRKDGEVAYEMDEAYHRRKHQILAFLDNPKSLARLPTKRKVAMALPRSVSVSSRGAKITRITIDDVASFAKVRRIKPSGHLPATVSETVFKEGIEKIIREPGGKKDWGGERNDLHTTRLKLKTTRVGAAFAFKGPGKKAKTLTPGLMGKNGDQIQRLFQTDAEVFFVQYWRDIGEAVLEQMRTFAIVKSIADGNRVYYGVIDGADSNRLFQAYQSSFAEKQSKRNRGK